MNFQVIKPSAVLSPFIKHYWTLSSCVAPVENHMQRIIPNGFSELIFYFNNIPEYIRQKQSFSSGNMLNGQQNQFYDILITDSLEILSVVFQPYGIKLFLDIPSSEIYNQSIPGEFIFNNQFKEINSKMQEKQNMEDRIKVLEDFLTKQLKRNKEYELKRMTDSIAFINTSGGNTTIEKLSLRACLSEKQYKRTFEEFVGISPKKFLRIIRFQNCLFIQQKRKLKKLTELAHESGYYDQAHMINDFKSLSGLTPKQYFAECDPYSDYFS